MYRLDFSFDFCAGLLNEIMTLVVQYPYICPGAECHVLFGF